jgi:hypothetical protein
MTRSVWIYEEGDVLKIFDTDHDARAWFKENDPEGVAFKHELELFILPAAPINTACR